MPLPPFRGWGLTTMLSPHEIPQAISDLEKFIIQHHIKRSLLPEEERKKIEEDEDYRINKAHASIPQFKIIDQAHYLKEHMLPRIAKNRGEESEDYQFYFSLVQSLMYMLAVLGRDERLKHELSNMKLLRDIFQSKCLFYEKELQKYTTMEDLLSNEASQVIMKIFLKNIGK